MQPIPQNACIAEVFQVFRGIAEEKCPARPSIIQWYQTLKEGQKDLKKLNEAAEKIFQDYPAFDPCTNRKRYRYGGRTLTATEQLLNRVFATTFREAPAKTMQITKTRASYSPLKRGLRIHLPRFLSGLFGDWLLKVAASTASIACMIFLTLRTYQTTTFVWTARVIPLFINHTPLALVRLLNTLLNAKDFALANPFSLFFGLWATQQLLKRGPRVPYLTAAAECLNLWATFRILFHSPQTITHFLLDAIFDTWEWTWNGCNALHYQLEELAQSGEWESFISGDGEKRWQEAVKELMASLAPVEELAELKIQ